MNKHLLTNCDTKWKHEFVTELLAMNNNALFDKTLECQVADDWDGSMSKRGEWEAKKSMAMLVDRLKEHNFLSHDYSTTPQ